MGSTRGAADRHEHGEGKMKHMSLDQEDDQIKRFVQSLPVEPDGLLLELDGEAVVRVLPAEDVRVEEQRLKEALLRRRDASRAENEEWIDADQAVWNADQAAKES